jgi:hypothetical protein
MLVSNKRSLFPDLIFKVNRLKLVAMVFPVGYYSQHHTNWGSVFSASFGFDVLQKNKIYSFLRHFPLSKSPSGI